MPYDPNYDTEQQVRRRARKNVEQGQQQGQAANPVGSTPSYYDTAYNQVVAVDSGARGTLPTSAVLYLSGLSKDDRELARLGSLFARNFATPPWYVFGTHDPKKYFSPITGEHLSIKEARLFSNNFGAVPLSSMLQNALSYTEGAGYKSARGQTSTNQVTLDPELVGKFARAIADHAPDLNMSDALGASIAAAKQGYNPKTYANNLEMVERWYAATGSQVDERKILYYTNLITSKGTKAKSISDVVDAIVPGVRKATKQAQQTIAQGGPGTELPGVVSNYSQTTRERNLQEVAFTKGLPVPMMGETDITPDNLDNYWKQVQDEATRIRLDQDAFQNSWATKYILNPAGSVLHAMNTAYQDFFGGAVYVASYPVAGIAAAGSAIYDPQGDSPAATFKLALGDGHYQAQRLFNQSESPGSLIAEPMGDKYKHWVGPALDFAIGWELDPLVLAGKTRQAFMATHILPGVLEHGRDLDRLIETADKVRNSAGYVNFVKSVDKFSGSRISRKLFEADRTTMARTIYRLRGRVEARGTLDLMFMKALKDKVRQAISEGMSTEDAWREWQDGVKAHFLGTAPPDSIASKVVEARLNEGFRARQVADAVQPTTFQDVPLFYEHNGLWLSQADHQALMADVTGAIDEARQLTAFPGWLRVEVPGTSPLSEFGPRRAIRAAVTSPGFTETALGKRLAALPNMNPGRVLELNNAPEQYVYEHATRWSTFSEAQNRAYQLKAAEILNSGNAIETKMEKLINEINDDAVTYIMAQHPDIPPEIAEKMKLDLLEPAKLENAKYKEQVFGVVGDDPLRNPILESQLRNNIYVVDPVEVRQGIRRFVAMNSEARGALRKQLSKVGINFVTGTGGLWPGSENIYSAWLRFWKSLTVARPAYVSRVVLGDENLRFLATTQSMQDRLLSIAWGHRAAEDPNKFKAFLDSHFNSEMHIGDDVIPLPRPGAYPYESAAAGQVRQADILNETLKGRAQFSNVMKADGSYQILIPTLRNEDEHLGAWADGLTKQARNSEPGTLALESVADGDSVQATTEKLLAWARRDNFTTLRTRIGIDAAEADQWADDLSKVIHGYTANDARIARLALEGDQDKLKDAIRLLIPDPTQRPIVHAPKLVEATDGTSIVKSTNKLYDWFVRQPEDSLNRQPFYSLWKRRGEASMYAALQQNDAALAGALSRRADVTIVPGREAGVTPDLLGHEPPQVPRPTVGDADGYVYHVTPPENTTSIKTEGLLPREIQVGNIPVPDEIKGGRLFFADSVDRARELSWKAGDQVTFRVKAKAVGDSTPEQLFSGSQWTRRAIKPEDLEILGANGEWYKVTGQYLNPAIQKAVSNAARDFALGQVRRVMFDFTKQSRFTELLQFVFPFPQPFFEGFQAWGHIAYRNPTALVHGKQLFDLGVDSGFFKKDPVSGEYMVPATYPYKWALQYGVQLFGMDKRLADKFASPWIPLSSMNMLTSSTVKFGAQGPLGKVIGGVPIPVPGMHPPLQAFLMWANRNTSSPLAQGYLFQYGPNVTLFPRPVIAAANALGVDLAGSGDDSTKASMALAITEAMHRFGMDRDESGHLIPLNEQDRQKLAVRDKYYAGYDGPFLEDLANQQATDMLQARGLLNLFSPGPLRTAWEGQREDYAAFQNTIDENGGDYQKALDAWFSEYKNDPSKWFIPAGKTLAGEGYGEDNTAVRIPPSELVYQMYRMDGIGDLMRANKQWAALMLVGTDPSVQSEQNFMAFSDLISKGDIRYKTPAEYYQSASDAAGWQAYNEWKQSKYAFVEHNVEKYGSYESWQSRDSYRKYVQQRHEFFNQMYTTNPHWVLHNLRYSEQTQSWDWANGEDDPNNAIAARADLEHLVNDSRLAGFPGVDAMKMYVDRTNELRNKMDRNYLNDINSSRAQDMGLFKKYQQIVQDTINAAPDTKFFLSKYFNVGFDQHDKVTSTGDLVFNTSESEWRWNDVPPDLRDNLVKLDQKLYDFKNQAREGAMNAVEVAEFYNKADNLIKQTFKQDPKVMKAWWNSRNASEQRDYREYAAVKNIEYWTPFDFSTLPDSPIKLSKRAQGWLNSWGDARLQITRWDENDPGYSASQGYDQINAHIRALLGKDKGFDQAVHAANTWGWGIEHVLGYGKKDADGSYRSESDAIWGKFLTLARQAQASVEKQHLHGWDSFDSDQERQTYRNAQNAAIDWVNQQRKHNAAFDQQWRQLQELNGDPIIGSLVLPNSYYGPLGSKDY